MLYKLRFNFDGQCPGLEQIHEKYCRSTGLSIPVKIMGRDLLFVEHRKVSGNFWIIASESSVTIWTTQAYPAKNYLCGAMVAVLNDLGGNGPKWFLIQDWARKKWAELESGEDVG